METRDSTSTILGLCFLCSSLAFTVGLALGRVSSEKSMQYKAVQDGAARWISDEAGKPKFVWNKNSSPWTETDVTKK